MVNQLAIFSINMSSMKQKYDESYIQFGFSLIIVSGEEKLQCAL